MANRMDEAIQETMDQLNKMSNQEILERAADVMTLRTRLSASEARADRLQRERDVAVEALHLIVIRTHDYGIPDEILRRIFSIAHETQAAIKAGNGK